MRVSPSDIGKVIGKGGRIARALRTILSATSTKTGKRASLEIIGMLDKMKVYGKFYLLVLIFLISSWSLFAGLNVGNSSVGVDPMFSMEESKRFEIRLGAQYDLVKSDGSGMSFGSEKIGVDGQFAFIKK